MSQENEDIFSNVNVVLPKYLTEILKKTGFDSILSIQNINEKALQDLEKYINKNKSILDGIELPDTYVTSEEFIILPGHKQIILNLSTILRDQEEKEISNFILTELMTLLVDCAKQNFGNEPHQNRYNDIIRYFSIYIFLMSGRACYETLSHNLPIPHATTIRK